MDTQNYGKNSQIVRLADLRRRRTVAGAKQLRKALAAGNVQWVFLARDADPAITEPIEALCRRTNVSYTWIGSMEELGQSCGIEVGAAAAAVVE